MATSLTAATSDRFQEYSVGMHSAQIIASELGATTDMNNKFISTIVVHSKNACTSLQSITGATSPCDCARRRMPPGKCRDNEHVR